MKIFKKLLSLVTAAFILISAMPVLADSASVEILDLAWFLDIYAEHSFTVKISEGFTSASVYLDDELIEEIPSDASSYDVRLEKGSLKTIGTSVITVKANFVNEQLTDSQTVHIFPGKTKTALLSQDFTNMDAQMQEIAERYNAASYDPSIWNHSREFGILLGFHNGISTCSFNIKSAAGFEGFPSDDVSFLAEHPTGATGMLNVYLDFSFTADGYTVDNGIIDLSFDVYMQQGDGMRMDSLDTDGVSHIIYAEGNSGQWTHMNLIYDLENDKVYLNGVESALKSDNDETLSALNYLRLRMYPKAGRTMAIDNIKIDWYELKNTEFELISPSDGDVVTTNDLEVKYSAFGASVVNAYLDGSPVAQQSDISDDESVFNIQNLTLGRRELRLVAEYAGGITKEKTVYFTVVGTEKKPLGTSNSAAVNDFDTMSQTEYKDITALTDFILHHGGWKSNTVIKRIQGASGSSDDYAPLFEAPADGRSENKSVHLLDVLNPSASQIVSDGKLVLDFDYMINTIEDEYRLFTFGLWGGNGYTFVSDGKLCGTEFSLAPGTWYHFNLVYDVKNAKWTVSIDGETLIDGAAAVSSPFVTGRAVSFSVRTVEKMQNGTPAGFALDNVTIYNEVYKNI